MNYQQAREKLPLLADGELDPLSASEVQAHLDESPELRAELERWRALRHCANRVIMGARLPEGLEAAVRAELHRSGVAAKRRPYKWFAGITGIAAAVALTVWLWGWPGEAQSGEFLVDAAKFAKFHRRCAVQHPHDQFDLDLQQIGAAQARLATLTSQPVLLPDLRERQFELAGVCRCFDVPNVQVVHAHYRREGAEPAVVSLFSVSRKIGLRGCKREQGSCAGGRRDFEIAESQSVLVCKWDEVGTSFAVCSEMNGDQLRDLAEGVSLASLNELRATVALAE